MKKHFYSHLVEIEYIERELDTLGLSPEQKTELLGHIHSSIHYRVLDVVLSDLTPEQQQIFIDHLNNERHDAIWKHLIESSVGIEEKIRHAALNVGREFLEEIHKTKNKV